MRDGPIPHDARVAVATAQGRPYYYFSALLKGLGIRFDSILPDQMRAYAGHLVLTTAREYACSGDGGNPAVLFEDVADCPPAVVCGMMIRKIRPHPGSADELVIGIDPGQRSGLSITYLGYEIESSIHASVGDLVLRIVRVLGGLPARRRLVRIGDGDMDTANRIVYLLNLRFCSSFELELVDERMTSPRFSNFNCRSRRDIVSARHISRRDGRNRRRNVLPLSITG